MRHFILTIILISGLACAARTDHNKHDNRHDRYEHIDKGHHGKPSYFITDSKVFYLGKELIGANASSFKILKNGYAKDTWNVFYCGEKLTGASSNSFKVLKDGYAKDNWNVFYCGEKITGASSNSFKVLSDGYAKDNWNTYYLGQKV